MDKLSTQPYRGSRDFYPKEFQLREQVFNQLQKILELFAFQKIDAPLIEPIELYLSKTSEEIVNQQIYSFTDRGNRQVAIRPEMTPTVARMIAGKYLELPKPIRWYSIPNLWRYERPSKGRLREHWQLNADIFASPSEYHADIEILQLILSIMASFKANKKQFQVCINHRELFQTFFKEVLGIIDAEHTLNIARILDKKQKVSEEDFIALLNKAQLTSQQIKDICNYLNMDLSTLLKEYPIINNGGFGEYLNNLLEQFHDIHLGQCLKYNASIVRGFDYYTGLIFEVFDLNPENSRSLFGGGRYNNLVGSFIKNNCNAVGFGMGDVTFINFLETHQLLPSIKQKTHVYLANFEEFSKETINLAVLLRNANISVEVNLGHKKLSKQFDEANKKNIPFVILQGEEELKDNMVKIKDLCLSKEYTVSTKELISFIQEKININAE